MAAIPAGAQEPGAEGARQLGKIVVEADEDSYSADAVSVGGKTERDPKQIQQSVSVITSERIEDQNMTNVIDAVREATGVTVATTNYQSIYSRGFEINNLQYDGGSPALANNYANYMGLPDLAAYDHVEVLRGSDGLFAGAGPAGGTVNLVRKQPLAVNQLQFEVLGGSWKRYRAQLDATGPLGLDGRLRGRLVAAYEDREFFYDVAERDRTVLYGIVAADLTDATLLTVGGRFEATGASQYFTTGLPRFGNGADLQLPRSTCVCADWAFANSDEWELFAQLKQSLGDRWTLKANVSQQVNELDAKYLFPYGEIDPSTGTGGYYSSVIDYAPRQTLVDVTLSGDFELAGHKQELIVGANWQDVDGSSYKQKNLTLDPTYDIFDFNPSTIPEPAVPPYWGDVYSALDQAQNGIYVSLRSELTSSLHLVLGGRYSNYEYHRAYVSYDQDTGVPNGFSDDLKYEDNDVFTPYFGITYDLTQHVSIYGSYASTFESQANLGTESGEPLKPIEGDTYEVGAKSSWFDGALSAAAAAYLIKRENEGIFQPGLPGSGFLTCCYVAAAEVQSKGVDLEVTGELLPGWNASIGYTYNTNEYKQGYGENDGAAYFPLTPKHLLKIWTMARLPGALADWSIGGGINAQSANYFRGSATTYDSTGAPTGTVPYQFTQGSYVLASLRGEYRISNRWSAALNVSNLLDKTYYQTVGSAAAFNFYGEPRNFVLTLKGHW